MAAVDMFAGVHLHLVGADVSGKNPSFLEPCMPEEGRDRGPKRQRLLRPDSLQGECGLYVPSLITLA